MNFQWQIQSLLRRVHRPRVKVGPSRVCPGFGVFASESTKVDDTETILCMYPGIYSPGLPLHLYNIAMEATSEESNYLGGHVTPAGISPQDNSYILNLQLDGGGYLDGMALSVQQDGNVIQLDENPSACGHLINHSSQDANVTFVAFRWHEIIAEESASSRDDRYFALPNVSRRDGTPWYLDPSTGEIIRHEGDFLCMGAAFVALKDIAKGDELFLNYKLLHPLPRWAEEWYDGMS